VVAAAVDRLKVTEVFHSLQGEATYSGWPTVFIRLTGCPLRCRYCDTTYAFGGGEWRSVGELVDEALSFETPYVCVTGGEPLAQARCLDLLTALCDAGLDVSLETSGAVDISGVDPRVCRVVDIKTPGSGEVERNLERNVESLTNRDALKFVVCDRADYLWAKAWLDEHPQLTCAVFLSPSFDELAGRDLAEWMLEDRIGARLQLQLHKLIWGDVPGH
jgi:7-carboxy-7-deazaguanine synthase